MARNTVTVFRESLRPTRKLKESKALKEELGVEDEVAKAIAQIKEINPEHFQLATIIYERLGIEDPSEKLIKTVKDMLDNGYESIYDPDLRDAMDELLDNEPEDELHSGKKAGAEDAEDEQPVEERLGEFRKGSRRIASDHKPDNGFGYKD